VPGRSARRLSWLLPPVERRARQQHPLAALVGGHRADLAPAVEHVDLGVRRGAPGDHGIALRIDAHDVEARRDRGRRGGRRCDDRRCARRGRGGGLRFGRARLVAAAQQNVEGERRRQQQHAEHAENEGPFHRKPGHRRRATKSAGHNATTRV
jgi:hypothetical protein